MRIVGGVDPGGRPVALAAHEGRLRRTHPAGASLDASGLVVAPGLVDLQCNGGFGIDLLTEPERLWELAARLPSTGVTAWLPTIVSGPPDAGRRAAATLAAGPGSGTPVAVPLGLHLEGPVLHPRRAGAHPRAALRTPAEADTGWWRPEAGVRLVTLAPELPGGLALVRELTRRGVVVSAGHTDATAEELAAAADAGVRAVTHLFNAMSPFQHRAPGAVGAALADPRLRCGLIVDGVHVHPTAVAVAWAALGPDRTVLVTDAVAALGLPDGPARLGGAAVTVGPDGVRLADGTLAGSALALDRAVRNLVAATGCPAAEALAAASATPAALLGARDRGHLGEGARADLVLLDERLEVVATVIGGRLAHLAPGHEGRWSPGPERR